MKEKFKRLQPYLQGAVGVLVLCTILIVTIGVAARLLKIPVAWTDETLQIIFVWLVFIMSAVGFLCDDLIGLDLVEDMLRKKPNTKKGLKLIQAIAGILFALFMVSQTCRIVITQYNTHELTPVLSFPVWMQSFGYFLGCALFFLFAVYKIYIRIKNFIRPKETPDHP
ncbi:MAG: TRAP transporter small permease [Anaerotruncus sp.]|nr:TRAP transporter small permease [Anaerotruncus sp.]